MPRNNEQPVRLFRLPYAGDIYLCTCGAAVRSDCTCSQELTLTTHYNRHLRDPEIVAWLIQQDTPFTTQEAADALGFPFADKDIQLVTRMHLHRELDLCGCSYDIDTKKFTPPGVDTLRRLNLRPHAGNQSLREESRQSPLEPVRHHEHSPAPHEDRQSPLDDLLAKNDPPAPQ